MFTVRHGREQGLVRHSVRAPRTCAMTNKYCIWGCKWHCLPKSGHPAGVETQTLSGAKKMHLKTDTLCSLFAHISLFSAGVVTKNVLVPCSIFMAQKLCAAG